MFSGGHNISFSHSDDDIEHTLQIYEISMSIFAEALEKGDAITRLEGKPVQPVFRQA